MSEIREWIRENCPGVEVIRMPSIDLVNQLLKLSETDKDRAIKELINLYRPVIMGPGLFDADFCRKMVEMYLMNPYLVYDPINNQTLTVMEDLLRK